MSCWYGYHGSQGGSATILKEAQWLPYLQNALPVAVPEILAVGEPAHGYPEHWSVVRWIDGEHPTVAASDTESRHLLASDLANVVRSLRDVQVPAGARIDAELRWYRAEPLGAIAADIRGYAAQCRLIPDLDLDMDAVLRSWDEAMATAEGPGPWHPLGPWGPARGEPPRTEWSAGGRAGLRRSRCRRSDC